MPTICRFLGIVLAMYYDDHGHPTGLTPDIPAVSAVRHGVLKLTFADGLTGEVDVLDRMH